MATAIIFIYWILFSILVSLFARKRGRNEAWYFLMSIILSPLFTWLYLLVLSDISGPPQKKCPACYEKINKDANICKHCREDVSDVEKELDFNKALNQKIEVVRKKIIEKKWESNPDTSKLEYELKELEGQLKD